MSSLGPSPFRSCMFQLSERLDPENLESLRYIYELPASHDTALKILCKLETQGTISASEPAKLEELFKSINRMDLAKKVKDYARLQKKKKNASKNDDLQISSYANVEVALTQARLLGDQIKYILTDNTLHPDERGVVLEVKKRSDELQSMLQSVKTGQYQASDSESDTTISPPDTINRKLSEALHRQLTGPSKRTQGLRKPQDHEASPPPPKFPLLPPTSKPPRFSQEESNATAPIEVKLIPQVSEREKTPPKTSEPRNPNINGSSSLLVTGTISKQKPQPPPKPKKLHTIQSKEMRELETEPTKVKTVESGKENRQEKDERDESGYGGTGDDHDFTDPLQFLKTSPDSPPPPPPSSEDDIYATPPPGYYKPLQTQRVEEASYYKLPLQQKKQQASKDERIYENTSSASSHNTL